MSAEKESMHLKGTGQPYGDSRMHIASASIVGGAGSDGCDIGLRQGRYFEEGEMSKP